jgi:hypothetical protein
VQTFSVGDIASSDEFGFIPFPEVKNQLLLTGDKARARVNLDTGEIFSFAEKEASETLFYEAGERILYLRQIAPEKKDETKQGEARKDSGETKDQEEGAVAYEFGELEQKDLTLHPTLTLKIDDLMAKGIGELTGLMDVNPSDLKIATTEDPLKGKQPRLLLIGQSGIDQILEAGIKEKSFKLGNPQWSRDGKTIYVPALIEDDKAKTNEFAVVELSADGKNSRSDRIAVGPQNEMGSDYLSTTQIALSPDGKIIAASNGYTDGVKPEKIGLYLLDLSKPNRPVSFYPAPVLPKIPGKE